jgi:ABC-type nitrate/sulfonate/bicarbonate transport system substrate-binding protein
VEVIVIPIRSSIRNVALAGIMLTLIGLPLSQVRSISAMPASQTLSATLVLDWFPNTNHAGVYLAQANGWYKDAGIDLRIESPSDVNAATKLTANGTAELGIGYQASVTLGRAQDIPVVSVAGLVQHNLGAFAAKAESGITRPSQFVGKRYGSSGVAQTQAQLRTVMKCDGVDPSQTEEVTVGQGITQALLADRVDYMSLLWTWEGIQLEMNGTALNYIHNQDWCLPDTYNLVFISGERTIRDKPEVLQRFLTATQRGYEAAVTDQAAANAALLAAAPDLDADLVRASMDRLAPYFIDENGRWGYQKEERWVNYANWLSENQLVEKPVDGSQAFTNSLLPQ